MISIRHITSFAHFQSLMSPSTCYVITMAMMTSLVLNLPLTSAAISQTSQTPASQMGVREDPRVNLSVTVDWMHRNWSAVEQGLRQEKCDSTVLPLCHNTASVSAGNTSMNNMAACPWEILTDTNPRRVPREIHYARCICRNPRVTYRNGRLENMRCRENYITVPYLLCDRDPLSKGEPGNRAPSCQLNMRRVAVSCGASFLQLG